MSVEIEVRDSVSPSAMNKFFGCGAQFRYDKLFEKNLITQIYTEAKEAQLGTNFHSAIIPSYFEAIPDKPTSTEIEEEAKASFEANFDNSLWSQEKTARQILANFILFEKQRAKTWPRYKPDFMERRFSTKDFTGIIDFYCDGVIIDWKTGGSLEMNHDLMRQGRTYRYFIEDVEKLPFKKVIFPALQIGKVLELPSITLGWLQEERRRFLSLVSSGQFTPNRSFRCKWCPYILRCFNEGISLWD